MVLTIPDRYRRVIAFDIDRWIGEGTHRSRAHEVDMSAVTLESLKGIAELDTGVMLGVPTDPYYDEHPVALYADATHVVCVVGSGRRLVSLSAIMIYRYLDSGD